MVRKWNKNKKKERVNRINKFINCNKQIKMKEYRIFSNFPTSFFSPNFLSLFTSHPVTAKPSMSKKSKNYEEQG